MRPGRIKGWHCHAQEGYRPDPEASGRRRTRLQTKAELMKTKTKKKTKTADHHRFQPDRHAEHRAPSISMPSQLLPGGHFWLLFWFQLKDNLPFFIPRPKIPVTFDSKSLIKKALHPFFLPTSPPFAETFRMNKKKAPRET
jgi:hypothetical protein